MDTVTHQPYPIPPGVHAIPESELDLRPDADIDYAITHAKAPTEDDDDDKNIWFFWHSGYADMPAYQQRNVRAWHRRFSKRGWTVRVVDVQNVSSILDVSDPATFPRAFTEGTLAGPYARQHTSDLVRFPLLLRYGGVYADAGMLQIGDLDTLWRATVAAVAADDPTSPVELLSYNGGPADVYRLMNYFLAARRGNPLLRRAHRLLLALWAEDGGKTSTEGMHASALLRGVPLMSGAGLEFEEEEEDGRRRRFDADEVGRMLTDYIIQGQAITMAMGIVDDDDEDGGWDGPRYVARSVYAIEYMEGSQLINELTRWDGPEAFRLMSLRLPQDGETESDDQCRAREIVEACLRRSFGFKLATGLILRVMGDTLSSLWRRHEGSDVVPGTYAHWLRHGMVHWCPDELPKQQVYEVIEPLKRGPLLREA